MMCSGILVTGPGNASLPKGRDVERGGDYEGKSPSEGISASQYQQATRTVGGRRTKEKKADRTLKKHEHFGSEAFLLTRGWGTPVHKDDRRK